ncbi:DUF4328 domain-containing protein [Kitasatospora brasiliensis]|uniref:DUF4328 domain-containing protein n=1 Tax=Kitasatospora brasiliensis TaxID=3058040 RepID=UPI0029312588|nr:DUF4328 domain-containing protein [Kitasatospora sp. K002]
MSHPAVYCSPRSSAIAATVLLGVCAAMSLVSLGTGFLAYAEAGRLGDTELSDASALLDVTDLYGNIGVVHLLVLLVSMVTFISWFHRVRVNAEVFDPRGHRFKRGWAIWGWIIPIVALWFPWQITADIWRASARPDESGVRLPHAQPLLNLWWASFVLTNLIGRLGSEYESSAEYADTYQEAVVWLIVSDLVELVSAGLAIVLVHRLTAMQEKRFTENAGRAYAVHGATVWG